MAKSAHPSILSLASVVMALVFCSACKPPQKVAIGASASADADNETLAWESMGPMAAAPPGSGDVAVATRPPPQRSDAELLRRFANLPMVDVLAELSRSKGDGEGDGGADASVLGWESGVEANAPTGATRPIEGSHLGSAEQLHFSVLRDIGLPATIRRAPMAATDIDGDGRTDVVSAGADSLRLYRQMADAMHFEEIEDNGLAGIVGGAAIAPADFDADGRMDLLILRGDGWPSSLLRNLGDGRFADVTDVSGLLDFRHTRAAVWADFDADGRIDVLLANAGEGQRCGLYFGAAAGGEGGHRFHERSHEWGLRHAGGGLRDVVLMDFDHDGWLDVVFGGEATAAGFYRNVGGRRFEKLARADADAAIRGPLRVADLDEDGHEDLLAFDGSRWRWWRNAGTGVFEDVSATVGLDELRLGAAASGTTQAPPLVIADFDGDGDRDLLGGSQLRLALNRRGDRLVELADNPEGLGALSQAPAKSNVATDFDGDGDVDLLAGDQLVLSEASEGAAWTRLPLNRDLAGAAVTVTVRDDGWVQSQVHRRIGYGQNTPLAIGLGEAEVIVRLEIRPPGGTKAVLEPGEGALRGEIELPVREAEEFSSDSCQ